MIPLILGGRSSYNASLWQNPLALIREALIRELPAQGAKLIAGT